jgi:hypothetical protein
MVSPPKKAAVAASKKICSKLFGVVRKDKSRKAPAWELLVGAIQHDSLENPAGLTE